MFMNPAFAEMDMRSSDGGGGGRKKQPPPKPIRRPDQFAPVITVADGSPRLKAERQSHSASPERMTHLAAALVATKSGDDAGGVVRRKKNKPKAEEAKAALRRSVSMGSDFFISELGTDEERRDVKQSPLVGGGGGSHYESSPSPSTDSMSTSPFPSLRNIPTAVVNDIRAEMDALLARIQMLESENKVLPALRHQVGALEMEKQELRLNLESGVEGSGGGGGVRDWSKGAKKSMSSSMVSLQLLQDENRRIPELQQRVVELEDENRALKRERQFGLVLGQKARGFPEKQAQDVVQIQLKELESRNAELLDELEKWRTAGESTLKRRSGDDEIRRELREVRARNVALEKDVRRLQKNSTDATLLTQVADSAIAKWKESEQQVKAIPKLKTQLGRLEEDKRRLEAQVVALQQQQQQQFAAAVTAQSPARSASPLVSTPSGSFSSLDSSGMMMTSPESSATGSAYQIKLMDENMKLKKTVERLRGECAGLAQSVNNLKTILAEERQSLGGQLQSVTREMGVEKEQLSAENNRLKQQNRRLLMERRKATIDEKATVELASEKKRVDALNATLSETTTRLRETEAEVTELRSLRDALDDVFVRMTELQRTCGLPDSQVDSVAHAAEVIEETQSRLQSLESRCVMLERDQEQTRCAYKVAKGELDAAQAKMHDYVEELASLERRLHNESRSVTSLGTENEQLAIEKHELLETVRGLRVENSLLWQKAKDAEEQNKNIQHEVDRVLRALKLEEQQSAELKVDVNDGEALVNDLKDEVQTLQSEKRVLESRLHILESTSDEKHRLALELKEQEVILAVQEKFQRQLTDVENVVEERRQAMDEHFNYLEEVNAEKTQKCDELQKLLATTRNQCAELEEEASRLRADVATGVAFESERRAFDEERRQLTETIAEKESDVVRVDAERRRALERAIVGEDELRKATKEKDALASEFERVRAAHEAEIDRLGDRVKEVRETLATREAEWDRLGLEHDRLLREKELAFGSEIAQRELRIEQLQNRIDELQSELPAASEETRRLRETVDDLQVQLSASEGRLLIEEKTNAELKDDVERLAQQLDKEKREKNEAAIKCERMTEEVKVLSEKIVVREKESNDVRRDYDETRRSVVELESRVDDMRKESERADQLAKRCDELDASLSEKDVEITQLTTSLYSVSGRVGDLERENSDLTEAKTTLEERVDELASAQAKAVQLTGEQRETMRLLQEKNVDMRRRLQQYEDETIPKMKEESLVLEKEKLDLEGQVQLLNINLSGLGDESARLKTDLDETRKARADLDEEKRDLERRLADLKGTGDELDVVSKSLRDSEKQLRQLQDSNAALREDLREARSKIVSLQKETEAADDQMTSLRSEKAEASEDARKTKEAQDRVIGELKKTIEEAEAANAKRLAENERALAEKETLLKTKERTVTELEAKVKELVAEAEKSSNSVVTVERSAWPESRSGLLDADEVELLRSENRLMKDKVKLLEESVSQSRAENRQIQIVIDEMEKSIPAITEKNSKLQEENKTLRKKLESLTSRMEDIKELDQEKAQLEWKLQDYEQQLPVIQQQKQLSDVRAQEAIDLAKKCRTLEMQVDDLQDEISVQKLHSKQVPLLQEQVKFKQKEVKSFEGEVKMLHREIRELELEIAVWKQKNQELGQDREYLVSDVRELKLANQNLMLLVDQDKQDHAERGAQDIASLKQVIAELEKDNQQLQKRLDDYGTSQRQMKEESKDLVHLNDLVLELEEENNKLQSRREKDRRKIEEQTEKIKTLRKNEEVAIRRAEQAENLKTECVSLEAHVAELLKENEVLQSEINKLKGAGASSKAAAAAAAATSTTKSSKRRASTPERGVVTALGGRIKELETRLEELQDELARVRRESPTSPTGGGMKTTENGEVILRRRQRTDEAARGELDRLPKRLSFLPNPDEDSEGRE